jgi:glycosyltransferase involved in cell wall biosynthesis
MDFRGALEPDPVTRSIVLFIRPTDSSFILTDQKIIESEYIVKAFAINQGKSRRKYLFKLAELVLFLLYNQRKSEAFITWFGDYHAAVIVLIGRFFRKPIILFVGGQETVCYKELGKGVYLKWFRGACVKYAIRNATLVLPNHRSLIYHENYFYDESQPHIDGIRHYVDNLKCRIEVIPNGIDHNRINRREEIRKEHDLVLTVGTMNRLGDFYNKGFDLFIEVARLCQDLRFVLIGIKREFLGWVEITCGVSKLTNLTIVPSFCSDEVLSEYYNRANVYVQVSITEGMPVSLGEAMLCECVPVGSNVNGIPDAIGAHGIVIHKRTPEALRIAIRRALELKSGKSAREHTLANFSVSSRRERIVEVLRDVIRQ